TVRGRDPSHGGALVGRVLDEAGILALLDRYKSAKLVVSPIGAQGFVLGRGNLQISPAVIRQIGIGNVILASTPAHLNATPVLRGDTGDRELEQALGEEES